MKKISLVVGMLFFGAGWMQAANCTATMTLADLTGAALPGGCNFNGFNFNNFFVGNYIATPNFSGAAQYDTVSTPANAANYIATFTVLPNGGTAVTFTGALVQTDGLPAWTIQTTDANNANANFSFEIKYNIGDGTDANPANNKAVSSLKTLQATLGGATYTGPTAPGSDASTTFAKTARSDTSFQLITDKLILTSGSQSKSLALAPNNTGTLLVTDNLSLQITDTQNAQLTVVSLANGFDFNSSVPEPVTMGLMGIGLAGLALLRKRQAS
jgi:hypothetical protein